VAELCAPWRALNTAGLPAPTQVLGRVVHNLASTEALRVASARDPSTDNLVILPDRLQPASAVRVFDDSGLIDAHLP
jgi:RES domain